MEETLPLYLTPHLRKWMLSRLGRPDRLVWDGEARKLWEQLEKVMHCNILEVVNDYRPNGPPQSRVLVRIRYDGERIERPDGKRDWRLEKVQAELMRAFLEDMYATTDWHRFRGGKTARASLLVFRDYYSITEDDHAYRTAERLYQIYCRKRGLSRPYKRRRTVRISRRRRGRA